MAAQLAHSLRTFLALPEEQRILGQYRLLGQLGSGGFAPVWLASERYGTKELRKVAIKLFAIEDSDTGPRNLSREETIVEEAQALCNVEHTNVVRFYTFTKDETNKVLGLVMEYVRGVSLDRRLEDLERLPYSDVIDVGIAIASALEAVHRVGLVHRDLKPANVIVSEGVYKLIDFGIASAERPQKKGPRPERQVVLDDLPLEVAATKASMLAGEALAGAFGSKGVNPFEGVAGTLGYMDPRCVSTQARATPASDFYALGATLFECAVGTLPATLAAKLAGGFGLKGEVMDGRAPAPSLAVAAPDAPPDLVAIVDSLLDPDPDRRPASATEVVAALSACRGRLSTSANPAAAVEAGTPPGGAVEQPRTNTAETAFGSTDSQPRATRGWTVPALAISAVVAAGVAGVTIFARGTSPVREAPASTVTAAAAAPSAASPPVASIAPEAPVTSAASGASAIAPAQGPVRPTLPTKPAHGPVKVTAAPSTSAPPAAATPAVAAPVAPGGVVEKSPY